MKITLPVTWEMCGEIEIDAGSIEEAIAAFVSAQHELPEAMHYVDGSFRLTTSDPEEIKLYAPALIPAWNDWRRRLHPGDEITWNDPDEGACARRGVILAIRYVGDDSAAITLTDGWHAEVLLSELS